MDKNRQDPLISNPREDRTPWLARWRESLSALRPQAQTVGSETQTPPAPTALRTQSANKPGYGIFGIPLAALILFVAWMVAYPNAGNAPFAPFLQQVADAVREYAPAPMGWIDNNVAPFPWQPEAIVFGVLAVRVLAAFIALGNPKGGIAWFWFSLGIEAVAWFGWKREITEDAVLIAGVDSLFKTLAMGAGFIGLFLMPLGRKKLGESEAHFNR